MFSGILIFFAGWPLSADEQKRLEYEAREKAIRDYNAGIKLARKQGIEQGRTITLQIIIDHNKGISNEEISESRNIPLEDVNRTILQYESA